MTAAEAKNLSDKFSVRTNIDKSIQEAAQEGLTQISIIYYHRKDKAAKEDLINALTKDGFKVKENTQATGEAINLIISW